MSKKSKFSAEEKYKIIFKVLEDHHSVKSTNKKYSLSKRIIKDRILLER